MMRILSLTQPWASFMAWAIKRNETRSWDTHYRGDLAIHATKEWTDDLRAMCRFQPYKMVLEEFGVDPEQLPHSAILAVVNLADSASTPFVIRSAPFELTGHKGRYLVDEMEEALGNYAPNRFAFITRACRPLRSPLPWRGQQGIRTLSKADEARIRGQLAGISPIADE